MSSENRGDDSPQKSCRRIFRWHMFTLCSCSLERITFTLAKYCQLFSFGFVTKVPKSFSTRYVGASFVSAAMLTSVRHALDGEAISVTMLGITSSFSTALLRAFQTMNEWATNCLQCISSRIERVTSPVLTTDSGSRASSHLW